MPYLRMALIKCQKCQQCSERFRAKMSQSIHKLAESKRSPGASTPQHSLNFSYSPRHILLAPRNNVKPSTLKIRPITSVHVIGKQFNSPKIFIKSRTCNVMNVVCLKDRASKNKRLKSLEHVFVPPEDSQTRVSSRIRESCRLSHTYKLDMFSALSHCKMNAKHYCTALY